MNIDAQAPISSVAEFLAHAEALERESVERYAEFADSLEVHNNPEIAQLFSKLAHFGEHHVREVKRRADGIELPNIAPWDFKWNTPEGPESAPLGDVHYLMGTREALTVALHHEEQGRAFYAHVAATSPDAEVRAMALEFAEEELQHVELLQNWIANLGDHQTRVPEDLDPPNMPE